MYVNWRLKINNGARNTPEKMRSNYPRTCWFICGLSESTCGLSWLRSIDLRSESFFDRVCSGSTRLGIWVVVLWVGVWYWVTFRRIGRKRYTSAESRDSHMEQFALYECYENALCRRASHFLPKLKIWVKAPKNLLYFAPLLKPICNWAWLEFSLKSSKSSLPSQI